MISDLRTLSPLILRKILTHILQMRTLECREEKINYKGCFSVKKQNIHQQKSLNNMPIYYLTAQGYRKVGQNKEGVFGSSKISSFFLLFTLLCSECG